MHLSRGLAYTAVALVVLYVGFILGRYYEENPEQRRAAGLLGIVLAALVGALVFAYAR